MPAGTSFPVPAAPKVRSGGISYPVRRRRPIGTTSYQYGGREIYAPIYEDEVSQRIEDLGLIKQLRQAEGPFSTGTRLPDTQVVQAQAQAPMFQAPVQTQPDDAAERERQVMREAIAMGQRQRQEMELAKLTESGGPVALDLGSFESGLDLSQVLARQSAMQGDLASLRAGRGPAISFDAARDPEAIAYRLAQQRAFERNRAAEAERAAATGTYGGGFDARLAGLRELRGEQESAFEAGLSGRRRQEALDTAIRGTELSMQDIGQLINALVAQENARQGARSLRSSEAQTAAGLKAQQQQMLIQALLQGGV